jgi:myo-inositol 2-dehydrogenase/D-chiro-inositol 1-dehydrogenase
MPPSCLNRRSFLGCSAAAGLAMAQGQVAEALGAEQPVRLGLIGLGNRGTSLLRGFLSLPGVQVVAVCDPEPRHRTRAQGIAEKASQYRPDALAGAPELLAREDVDAVAVAVPGDLHAALYQATIDAGKHLYAEKPLGLSVTECDAVIEAQRRHPDCVVHVGFQRRSHPRFQEAVERAQAGDLGRLLECRAQWSSSNGPIEGHGGWMGRRARSGDWMLEQAIHVWDFLCWLKSGPPELAFGTGHRDLFREIDRDRDVTDWYTATLFWRDGFSASFSQSWIAPADERYTGLSLAVVGTAGGLDLTSGVLTYRDRNRPRAVLDPASTQDTERALVEFLRAIRSPGRVEPPIGLEAARLATQVGLLVRAAVDAGGVVRWHDLFRAA